MSDFTLSDFGWLVAKTYFHCTKSATLLHIAVDWYFHGLLFEAISFVEIQFT